MFDGRPWPFFIVFFLFLAQNLLGVLFPGSAPSLPLVAVIYFSLRRGARFGTALGLFAGALMELYGQGPFGFTMACWAALGAASGVVATQVFQDSVPAEIFLPAFAAYFLSFAELTYRRIGEGETFPWDGFFHAFQPGMLAGTVFASLVLFSLLRKTSSRPRRRPAPSRR